MILRWICERDDKVWLYPIERCIYCKGPITKQKSRKAKVIGITKVNIPSLMHPIIPYNIILLEDEYGNKMPKKTMKDYNIGEDYIVEKAKTENAVIIKKVKYDLGESLRSSLELLKFYDIGENDKVIIKPSIIEPAYGYQAVATNSKILDALLPYLKENGVKDVVVAEQAMIGNDTLASAKKSGILDVCKKHNVNFVDLRKCEYVEKVVDGFIFKIAKDFFDRKIINIPVMKTNSQLGISGAAENMLRVADEGTQKRMFADDIEKTLPRLLKTLPNFLTIGDAIIGLQGQGPTLLGEPAFLNLLFVSKDPVALDTIFVEMGLLPTPEYIKEAASLGIGNNDVKLMEIVGDELEAIKLHLKPAEKGVSAHPRIKLIDGKANPYIFNSALKMTAKLVGLLGEEINLVIGSEITKDMVADKKRLVVYGKEAFQKVKEWGIIPLAEIPEDVDDLEKIMLLKSVLENPDKKKITVTDKLKSKIMGFGAKIKENF
ncbi:MAG: DUF362 domain-containing protein [Candidatus Woesearchaeota archaeon]|jgi:uncharacterized protein (DUF362 family)|nr:DUF362 domain-containing protein [Candidatus Woesearchaeota archaeon]